MEQEQLNPYINLYDKIFLSFKECKISLLEIVNYKNNDNKLWKDYFKNGEIYEINSIDAYNDEILSKRFNNKRFNIIIENGTYDLNSLIKFIKTYLNYLTYNGILLIKNIQSVRYIQVLKNATPLIYHKFIEAYDIREVYGKYDDVIYVINKSSNEVPNEVLNEVPNEVPNEVLNEVPNEVLNEVLNEVTNEVPNEVLNEVPNEVSIEVPNEVSNEVSIEDTNKMTEFNIIYNLLFKRIRDEELILLNIGLNENIIKYLLNTFNKSVLIGIGLKNDIDNYIKNNNRVKLYLGTNPYDINLESSNIKFNVIISNNEKDKYKIIFLINTYSKLLNTNGIMIIEDVEENDISFIRDSINQELKDIMETYKENNKNIIIINK